VSVLDAPERQSDSAAARVPRLSTRTRTGDRSGVPDFFDVEPVEPAEVLVPQETSTALLPPWWPLALVTVGFPIWWILGLSVVAWPIVAIFVIGPKLVMRSEPIRVPSGFGWWMAFMFWVVLSVTQLDGSSDVVAFGYRFSIYVTATLMFLYVYNESEARLPTERVLSLLTGLAIAATAGGLIGVLAPRLNFPSVLEIVLPDRIARNEQIQTLSHVQFAQVQRLYGRVIGRPHALFSFTNEWGSAVGILVPIAVASLLVKTTSTSRRILVSVLFLLSVFSVVVSLNRGLWISLAVAFGYSTFRFVLKRQVLPIVLATAIVGLLGAALYWTPLGDLAGERVASGHSDEGRSSLYQQAIALANERPVLGWGTPQPRTDQPDGPKVGTHGHLWLVAVSQGWVGLALYLAWWSRMLWTGFRQATAVGIWIHAAVVVFAVQLAFYEHTPIQLPIVMVLAAVLARAKARPVPLSITSR